MPALRRDFAVRRNVDWLHLLPQQRGGDRPFQGRFSSFARSLSDELPFAVELWDEDKANVERLMALTANGSIGFSAYYEVAKEYPGRYVTLRLDGRIVARWNPPKA